MLESVADPGFLKGDFQFDAINYRRGGACNAYV